MARTNDIQNDPTFRLLRWRQNLLLSGLRRHRLCVDRKPCPLCRDGRMGIVLPFRQRPRS
jgi:hypothetical protein